MSKYKLKCVHFDLASETSDIVPGIYDKHDICDACDIVLANYNVFNLGCIHAQGRLWIPDDQNSDIRCDKNKTSRYASFLNVPCWIIYRGARSLNQEESGMTA